MFAFSGFFFLIETGFISKFLPSSENLDVAHLDRRLPRSLLDVVNYDTWY